jgi:dTDP-glucose 4,6-dehydratase
MEQKYIVSDNRIVQEDIEIVAEQCDFSHIKNKTFFITGSTGLIGSQIIRLLVYLNHTKELNANIIALIRSNEKAEKKFGMLFYDKSITWLCGDIQTIPNIEDSIDYIIHGASVTSSQDFIHKPVETIDIAFCGTRTVLDLAIRKHVKSVVYLSSMEVFGVTDNRLQDVKEEDYGYIDILNPRSSYSESKRLCECLCASFFSEYKLPVKIARLTQTLGTEIDINDSRVTAQFIRSVKEKKDIVLKTEGKTRRPIVYIRDALSAILLILVKGENGAAYTVANTRTTQTIRATAEMIAHVIAKDTIKVTFDINVPKEYAPNLNLNLNLNTDRLEKLGWKSTVDLQEAYERIINSIQL